MLWLDLDKLGNVEKDAALFPTFTSDVRRLLRQETELFVSDVVANGNLTELLHGSYTFMNRELAADWTWLRELRRARLVA